MRNWKKAEEWIREKNWELGIGNCRKRSRKRQYVVAGMNI